MLTVQKTINVSGISKFTSLHLRVSGILRANPMTKEM